MMRLLSLALVALVFIPALGQSSSPNVAELKYVSYPSPGAIETHFNTKYQSLLLEAGQSLEALKHPDGWYLVIRSHYAGDAIIDRQLIWSYKTKEYEPYTYLKINYESWEGDRLNFNDTERYLYNRLPYFGYHNWSKDVIAEYASTKALPDTMYYAVGRAYSNEGSEFFRGRTETINEPKVVPDQGGNYRPEDLDQYRKYYHSAQDFYFKAYEQNPVLEVFIGDIYTKWSNEHMCAYLDLRYLANDEEAEQELREGLYAPYVLTFAKNMLKSCPPDAILFTHGDNDTYPLLYVQSLLGFRTDVTVVNQSLLNLPRYAQMLQRPYQGRKGLYFSLSDSIIADERSELIVHSDDNTAILLESFLDSVRYAPLQNISANSNKGYLFSSFRFSHIHDNDTMEWSAGGQYFYRSAALILDLIYSNDFIRPICFGATVASSGYVGLDAYVENYGLCYRLVSENGFYSGFAISPFGRAYNTDVMYENLMEKCTWEGMDVFETVTAKHLGSNQQLAFIQLMEGLMAEGDTLKAHEVSLRCHELFPVKRLPGHRGMIALAEKLYDLGEDKKADTICRVYINDINNKLDPSGYFEKAKDREQALTICNRAYELATRYGRAQLLAQSKEMLTQLERE